MANASAIQAFQEKNAKGKPNAQKTATTKANAIWATVTATMDFPEKNAKIKSAAKMIAAGKEFVIGENAFVSLAGAGKTAVFWL